MKKTRTVRNVIEVVNNKVGYIMIMSQPFHGMELVLNQTLPRLVYRETSGFVLLC